MNLVRRSWLVVLMTLFVGVGTGFAQSHVQLAQGRRPIEDKVSFVVDIGRAKQAVNDPRLADGPFDVRINMRFTNHAATGRVYVDGKAIGRFDESMSFYSNPLEMPYGRHTITLAVTAPATLLDLNVLVSGGVAREILDDVEPSVTLAPDISKRVAELERKVQDLEAEIAGLKKKRNH